LGANNCGQHELEKLFISQWDFHSTFNWCTSMIGSTFVNSLKDKQCRLIFTAAFSHIYQGFQYQWRALYIILFGQSWHSNVFCIIDSCLKQLIFYSTNSISLGTLWSLFSHIINSNPYLILLIYTYRISTMKNPNKINIVIMCTALWNALFWLAKWWHTNILA